MNYEDIIAVLEWEDKCDKESKNEFERTKNDSKYLWSTT